MEAARGTNEHQAISCDSSQKENGPGAGGHRYTMKAFLLAAGRGTRLRPLTDTIPKCLVPINGKPLLHYWLALCAKYGISDVLINLHHFPEQVREYVEKNDFGLRVSLTREDTLLGSGGTVKANSDYVRDEECFLILYADNLTNVNLKTLLDFHRRKKSLFTMGLFQTDNPGACGIAAMDQEGSITSFVEKPTHPQSNLANAGIYAATPAVLQYFPDQSFIDLGFDVLPRLVGKMHGYLIDEYLLDVGTYENYQRAQSDVQSLEF